MNYHETLIKAFEDAMKELTRREQDVILEHHLEEERREWEQQNQDDEWYHQLDADAERVREFLELK